MQKRTCNSAEDKCFYKKINFQPVYNYIKYQFVNCDNLTFLSEDFQT